MEMVCKWKFRDGMLPVYDLEMVVGNSNLPRLPRLVHQMDQEIEKGQIVFLNRNR